MLGELQAVVVRIATVGVLAVLDARRELEDLLLERLIGDG
jgi:hypothetical protein